MDKCPQQINAETTHAEEKQKVSLIVYDKGETSIVHKRVDDPIRWFAMRATYRHEIKMRDMLQQHGIETFVPMKYTFTTKGKKVVRTLTPVINGLIFVHTDQRTLQPLKVRNPYLQYIVDKNREKIIVPEQQMRQFINICNTYNENIKYLEPTEINLSKGTKVRITGGEFEGYEGTFIKVKGARDRRVVVEIQGIIAVAMATIPPELIQPIKK